MLSCSCPSCGAPIPLTLALTSEICCRACRTVSPTPAEVQQWLLTARTELFHLDVRSRQFDVAARTGIRRAIRSGRGTLVALILGASPFVAVVGYTIGQAATHSGPVINHVTVVLLLCVPGLIYGLIGRVLYEKVTDAKRKLLTIAAAVPPERPGDPSGCSLCGAPLSATGADAIARCQHCGADSVVHPKSLALAATRRAVDLHVIHQSVRTWAAAASQAARDARRKTGVAIVITPVAGFFSLVALLLLASVLEPMVQFPPSDLDRYAWLETKRGRCLALMGDSDGTSRGAHFGDNDRLPMPARVPEEHAATLELFPASDVVGQKVRLSDGTTGTVARVLGAPVTNREQFVLEDGSRGDAPGSCAVD